MLSDNADSRDQQSFAISRRTFISSAAAVGALHFIGSFFSPRGVTLAFADDEGQTHFKIYVLNREQVPIMALNVRNGANTPLPGMKVTLTSLVNDKTVTVYTDKYGCAVANIRPLADNASDNSASSYGAWVRVESELKTWRRFIETKRLVESGIHADADGNMPNLIQVPSMPDTGTPYLSCLCLDGVDVQYLPQTVGLNAANDKEHTLEIRVEHTDKRESHINKWRFALRDRYTRSYITDYVYATPQNDAAEATLTGVWLDGNHGIASGSTVQVYYSPVDNELMGLITLPLTFKNIELPMPGLEEDLMVSPGQEPSKDNKSCMGEFFDWFVCKNDTLNLGIPFVPMEIFIDIYGNMGIAATILTCTLYKYQDGKGGKVPKEERWKDFTDNSGKAGWLTKFKEDMADNANRWLESAMDGDNGELKAFGASPVTSKLTVTFTLELQGYGSKSQNDEGDPHYHGDMAIITRFAVNYMAAQQLTVAFVPVYWMFDFKAQALFKLLSGIQFDKGFKNLDFGHQLAGEYSSQIAVVFFMEIEAGFTVGVGVVGILSVGIRGYGNLSLIATTDTSGGGEDAITPHISITGKANIQLAVQVLLFKKTIELTNWGPWDLYDNWDKDDAFTKMSGSNALPGNRFGSVSSAEQDLRTAPITSGDMEQVSEESLAACAEFEGTLNSLGICTYGANTAGNPALLTSIKGSPALRVYDENGPSIHDPYAGVHPVAGVGSSFGADGYNPLRGIHPTTQTLLWQDVFSAPRAKVIRVGAETYLLRISTVTVEVESNNESLQLVEDSKGHVFAKAKPDNTLPHVTLAESGDSLVYPDLGQDVCVARIDSFEAGYEADQKDEQGQLLSGTKEKLANLVADLNDNTGAAFASTQPANTEYVTRSRLTISRYLDGAWREPKVIDFVLPATSEGYLRANTWDVDFDAVGFWNNTFNKYRIYILLSSVVRVVDDDTYDEQFKSQFITMLSYNTWDEKLEFAYGNLSDHSKGAVCWHPRITVAQRDYDEKGKSFDVVSVFYYRNDLDEYGNIDYSETYMMHACWSIDTNTLERHRFGSGAMDLHFDEYLKARLAEGTFEVSNRLYDNLAQNNFYAIGWHAAPTQYGINHSAAVFWTADAQTGTEWGNIHIEDVEHCTQGPTNWSKPMESQWFYTLASANGGDRLLRRLTMRAEPKGGYATVTFTSDWPIGQIANAQAYFSDASGKHLYAVRAMEGSAMEIPAFAQEAIDNGALVCGTYNAYNSKQAEHVSIANEQGGQNVLSGQDNEGDTIQQYQVLCAHYDYQNGSYHDFFPLAELNFAPDYVIPLNLETGNYEFLMGSITDLNCNRMSVYHVTIPQVLGLQLEGAGAVSHFAMPGDVIKCQVRLTNTGNTPIIGFDATLWDDELSKKLSTITVRNLAGTVQFSEDMVRPVYTDDGQPTQEYEKKEDVLDRSGFLWPGKVRSYHAMFTLPEDLGDGQRSFHITVSNPIKEASMLTDAGGTSLSSSTSAVENLCLAIDPRARRFEAKLGAEAIVESDRVEPEWSTNLEPGGNAPKTGDASWTVGTTALAAAAAAGLAAAGAKLQERFGDTEQDAEQGM